MSGYAFSAVNSFRRSLPVFDWKVDDEAESDLIVFVWINAVCCVFHLQI